MFFFNDAATTEIYTLSLHDALPICKRTRFPCAPISTGPSPIPDEIGEIGRAHVELQSPYDLVCRLLLEKKKSPIHDPRARGPPAHAGTLLIRRRHARAALDDGVTSS